MRRMKEKQNTEYSITDDELSDDSGIEMQEKTKQKPQRKKSEYVLTDARKANFEKARQKRMENIQMKKKLKEEEDRKIKEELENKLMKKANALKKRVAKKKQVLDDIVSSETESDAPQPIVIRKKKKKPQVIYLDESSEEEKPIVIKKRTKQEPKESVNKDIPKLPRIIQYM